MATQQATIRIQRPIMETTGTGRMEREQRHETPGHKLRAWVVPIRAERSRQVLGVLTDAAIKCRFRAPNIQRPIKAGWRISYNGEVYEVRTATNLRGLWNVIAERVG